MTHRFNDRVVVVTGAARGIGFETARQFALEGALVVVNDLDPTAVADAAGRIDAEARAAGHGRATGLAGDAGDDACVRGLVGQIVAAHGAIDVLVNNAGIMARAPAAAMPAERWRRVLSVNLDGTFWWSQAVAALSMIPRRRGAIVNVASMAGLVAIPHAVNYVASKHAVVGLTKALAIDWSRYGIRVNAVCPGMTTSELSKADRERNPTVFVERERRIPLGRAAAPAEQARAILFLASDAARHLQGHALVIDGGQTALSSGHATPHDDPAPETGSGAR